MRALALICFTLICCLILSCGPEGSADLLERNLRMAKHNRGELERVLDHFADSGDSLKYQAARFLIENMDVHYTQMDTRTTACVDLLRGSRGLNQAEANSYVDSIRAGIVEVQVKNTRIPDLQAITADFLIEDIDLAFESWRNAPWFANIDFQTFCRTILPYRNAHEPLQSWRRLYIDSLSRYYAKDLDGDDMFRLVDTLLSTQRPRFRFVGDLPVYSDLGIADLLDLMMGRCGEWAQSANAILRAFGIPSVVMYTPQWATYVAGHAWNGIFDSTDHILPYAIEYKIPYVFDPMSWGYKTSKLYITTYAKNPASVAMQFPSDDKHLPPNLRNACLIDVTGRLVPVVDLETRVRYPSSRKDDVVFLCTFGRETYTAIDWGEARDGVVRFKDVGRDVVYLPAYYYNWKYTPAGDPVMVNYDGEISSLAPDTTQWREVRLYRKYPMKGSMFRYTELFKGMRVQTSGTHDFDVPQDRHVIDRYPSPVITDFPKQRDRWDWIGYRDSIEFDPPVAARYLRFLAAPGKECIVGEIECLGSDGRTLEATAYGTIPGAEYVQDGIYGECFHDADTAGWVALDFGKEVEIGKVRYLPSHDSNSIEKGDHYELSYWDGKWISLGVRQAEHKWLDWKIPANALFWLKNLDQGKEERIFTINDAGEQLWW